jgi:hypothetical protein
MQHGSSFECDTLRTRSWPGWPLLCWLVGIFAAGYPTLLSGFAEVQGGAGDPRLVNFTLEHGYRWLMGMPLAEDLLSPPIFYPIRSVASFTDLLLGVAPLYWPWRWLGAGPHTAYQLWMLSCWTLNYLACFLLLRRGMRVSAFAGGIGALLFAFFFLVLSILAAIEMTRSADQPERSLRNWLWSAALVAGLTLQFATALYPLIFGLFAAAAALIAAALIPSTRSGLLRLLRRNALPLAVCAVIGAAAVAPLLLSYLETAENLGMRAYSVHKLPRLSSWLLMGKFNLLYGWLHDQPWLRGAGWSLHHNGVGVLTTLLCAIGLWQERRNRIVQLMLVGIAALFVLTLRLPGDFSLWRLAYDHLPGAAALRAVARVGMMAAFPASVGLAVIMDRAAARRMWLAAGLSLLVLAEQIHVPVTFEKTEAEMRVATIAARLPADAEAFLLMSETRQRRYNPHDDAAWVAFATGVPTVNGRYGGRPRGWTLGRVEATEPEMADSIRRSLELWVTGHGLDPTRVPLLTVPPDETPDWRRTR